MNGVELATKNLVFSCRSGSLAYGTQTPTSDVDIRGVFIAPPEHCMSCFKAIDKPVEVPGEDTIYHELRKFIKLASACNPNVIELLFVRNSDILLMQHVFKGLWQNRELFLSQRAKNTFSAYAVSQMKRIKGHKKWISKPQPVDPPALIDFTKVILPSGEEKERFVIPGTFLIKTNATTFRIFSGPGLLPRPWISEDGKNVQHRSPLRLKQETGGIKFQGTLIVRIEAFQKTHRQWREYWEWKGNRNPIRAALEEQHSFDCYAQDTQFLTEDGWKLFDEVTDEKLATYNQMTGQIEYQNPIEGHDVAYTGSMYSIHGTHTDIRISGNHRMYVSTYSRTGEYSFPWEFLRACQLPDCFDVKRTINPKVRQFKNDEPCGIDLRFYLKIMGWYISDGSVAHRLSDGTPSTLSISQMQGGRLHWRISRARADYMKCGVQINEYSHKRKHKDKAEMIWTIPHREIAARITQECGIGAKNKKLPRWVFRLSERMAEILLDAMHAGDGTDSRPGNAQIYYTSSPQLANDVHELAFLCGYETSLWGPYNEMYHVHINKQQNDEKRLVRSANVTKEEVAGERIVCFTVPNEILITRRNGKIAIQGNSKHAMHLIRLLRMAEEILRDRVVNVYRPDREDLLAIKNGSLTYEQLLAQVSESEERLEDLCSKTSLPEAPDTERIDELYRQIVWEHWRNRGLIR